MPTDIAVFKQVQSAIRGFIQKLKLGIFFFFLFFSNLNFPVEFLWDSLRGQTPPTFNI